MLKNTMFIRLLFMIIVSALVTACTAPLNVTTNQSQPIEIRIDPLFDSSDCRYLGEVTGSEGHWYSYLFYTNDTMMKGAMNDLKNNAARVNADTVYMIAPQDFTTSFSVLGIAYRCK